MENKIKIISAPDKKNPFVIIYKPRYIPSAPLKEGEESALTSVIDLFPEIKNVKGKKEIEYGLVHRIDTATDGLLLIATTQDSYDFFIQQQSENLFEKEYSAVCDFVSDFYQKIQGFPVCEAFNKVKALKNGEKISVIQKSFFRPFGSGRAQVRPVTQTSNTASMKKSGTKEYKTEILIEKNEDKYFARAKIVNGYRHQVRCHLAWCGLPVYGDELYNPNYKEGDKFIFTACRLSFIHPLTKQRIQFSL